jgi:hypothetical protein
LSRRHLTEIESSLSGSLSARHNTEEMPFATEGDSKSHRQKALSGDLQNESFSNLSSSMSDDPPELTFLEKFINEIGYKH